MKKLFLSLLASVTLSSAFAEGYQVNVLSTKQTGMGHVGTGMKLGAESMHFNPAGLVYLNGHMDMSVGISGIFSNARYKNGDYSAKTDNSVGTPVYAYVGYRIYDNLAAGISLTTPYGNSLKWPQAWKGAHLIQDITLKSYIIQPTLSYKILDNLSVGVGLQIAMGNVNLSRALLPVGALVPILGADYQDVVPVSATLDGKSKVKLGYHIGVMYDVCDKVTLGLSYRSRVRMKVKEGTAELDSASQKIKDLGGYIQDSSVWGSSSDYSSSRSASYTLRIPSDKLDEFIDVVETLGNVTYKNESVDDVTLRYVDVDSHKKALETEQERLLALLEKAENVEDIITIENRLSDVRYELENYESQIRLLDNQIDYSTVYVDISEVSRVTDTGKQGFFEEVASRFSDSVYVVLMGLRGFAIGILGSLPILVVWGVILAVVVILLRKFVFKKSKKNKKNTDQTNENQQ